MPDIAITKHNIAVFCDGDFWHGKDWVEKKQKIKHNHDYWVEKIERNIQRDIEIDSELYNCGWSVVRFWGSEIHKNLGKCVTEVQNEILKTIIDKYQYFIDFEGYNNERQINEPGADDSI